MKFLRKLGLAGVLLFALLVSCSNNTVVRHMVFQLNNHYAINNANERIAITDDNGEAVMPMLQQGQLMLPLNWLANQLGWTVTQEQNTFTIIQDKKTQAQLQVDSTQMTVGKEILTLDTAPMKTEAGVIFVPLRAVVQAFDFHVSFVEEAQGGFIFIDNEKEKSAPTEEMLQYASDTLGLSQVQMLQQTVILRAGSDHALVYNTDISLKDMQNTPAAPIREEEDICTWLPVDACAAALGASVTDNGDGTLTVTSAQGAVATLGGTQAQQTAQTNDAEAAVEQLRQIDTLTYASAQAFAQATSLHAAELENGVVVLAKQDLTAYVDQLAYVQKLAIEALPDMLTIPKAKYYIALTFDDGPTGGTDGLTVKLLDGLKQRGAHATFFMCGYRIKDFHTHMERYLAEGHEVGNHTMDHPGILTKYSAEKVYTQFQSNNELIASYVGANPTVGRPVGGAYNDMVLEQMQKAGLPAINWSLDTQDWKYRDAKHVKDIIVNQAKDGDIILMHDLYPTSVQGALDAIDVLKEQGYGFVTVQELAAVKGITLEPGKLYTGFRNP